jgi:alkylhydroperoxidase family enzyme
MHTKDARAFGEDEQRLHVVAAWREAPFYSARERAALTFAVVAINRWNRLAVGIRSPVGGYVSPHARSTAVV